MNINYLYHFVFHCTVFFCIASYHIASDRIAENRIVCYRWLFHMSLKCIVSLAVYRDAYRIASVLKKHIHTAEGSICIRLKNSSLPVNLTDLSWGFSDSVMPGSMTEGRTFRSEVEWPAGLKASHSVKQFGNKSAGLLRNSPTPCVWILCNPSLM